MQEAIQGTLTQSFILSLNSHFPTLSTDAPCLQRPPNMEVHSCVGRTEIQGRALLSLLLKALITEILGGDHTAIGQLIGACFLPLTTMMTVVDFEHHHILNDPSCRPKLERDHHVHLLLLQSIDIPDQDVIHLNHVRRLR
jgi:hypothetical protein